MAGTVVVVVVVVVLVVVLVLVLVEALVVVVVVARVMEGASVAAAADSETTFAQPLALSATPPSASKNVLAAQRGPSRPPMSVHANHPSHWRQAGMRPLLRLVATRPPSRKTFAGSRNAFDGEHGDASGRRGRTAHRGFQGLRSHTANRGGYGTHSGLRSAP